MKPGVRALGVAESYRRDRSTFAGAVVRASRVVDGFSFASCTVGGLDATKAIVDLYDALDREDVRYLLLSGVAPAWFNIVDLQALHAAVDRPVIAVTFEESEGLEATIRAEFEGEARDERLKRYRALPARHSVTINGQERFVRPVGLSVEGARTVLAAFSPEGGRPEPIRVARLAARGFDDFRTRDHSEP